MEPGKVRSAFSAWHRAEPRQRFGMSNALVWVDIPVINLDRAIAFYSLVLGAPVTKQVLPEAIFGLLPSGPGGVGGALAILPGVSPSSQGPLVYLSVEGRLEAAVLAVSTGGGVVLAAKHPIGPYGFRALVQDTEGNRIALHSQVP